MSQTLAPKFFGTIPNIHDIYLFLERYHTFNFFEMSFGSDSQTKGVATFYYNAGEVTVSRISGTVPIEYGGFTSDKKIKLDVTPFIIDKHDRTTVQYAPSEVFEYDASSYMQNVSLQFEFQSDKSFSANDLLGIQIEAFAPTDDNFGMITIGRFSVEVDVEGGDSIYDVYIPKRMSEKIKELSDSIVTKKNELAFNAERNSADGIIFCDYDGTIVDKFTFSGSDARSRRLYPPPNPSHDGLVAQGWNWSYEKAKQYAIKYGCAIVGQNYVTDDGSTRFYVYVTDECLQYALHVETTGEVIVKWGDGAQSVTYEDSFNDYAADDYDYYLHHAYSKTGYYTISLSPVSGTIRLGGSNNTVSNTHYIGMTAMFGKYLPGLFSLQRIEFGENVEIDDWAFSCCEHLISVTFPSNLASIGYGAFLLCSHLRAVVLPNGISLDQHAFESAGPLVLSLPESVANDHELDFNAPFASVITYPEGTQRIQYSDLESALKIVIPDGVTVLDDGCFIGARSLANVFLPDTLETMCDRAFASCVSLREMVIPKMVSVIPDGIFDGCVRLSRVIFLGEIVSIGADAFNNCHRLPWISLPYTVESIGDRAFKGCESLKYIVIPANTADIGEEAFSNCVSLLTITLSENLLSIKNRFVDGDSSLKRIFFKSSSPPVGVGVNDHQQSVWYGLPEDCVLFIPEGSLEAYSAATGYPPSYVNNYVEIDYTKEHKEIVANVINDVLELEGAGVTIENGGLVSTLSFDGFIGHNDFVESQSSNKTLFFERVEIDQNG